MQPIHNTATVTSKGQITLPKFVRQTLGVDVGIKLAFTLQDGTVVVSRADNPQHQKTSYSRGSMMPPPPLYWK